MTYEKLKKKKEAKSLMMALEDAVLAMEASGQTEMEIFGYVNMILKGFIREGVITPEYIQLAHAAMERQQIELQKQWQEQEDQTLRDQLLGKR